MNNLFRDIYNYAKAINCNLLLFLLGFSLLCFIDGCGKTRKNSLKVAKLHLHFNQVLAIQGSQDSLKGYHLDRPTKVRTGSNGTIFVADPGLSCVLMFDSTGHFEQKIGRAGKGPGEFTGLSAIAIDRRHQLVAFDPTSKRISIFSHSGSLLSSHIPIYKTMAWPMQIRQLPNGTYVSLSKPRNVPNLKNKRQRRFHATVFHLYNRSFGYQSSFGNMDSLITKANAKVVQLYISTWNPGYFCLASDDGIWYAPGIYDGQLFKFKKGPRGWMLAKTVSGHLISSRAVTLHYKGKGAWVVVRYSNIHSPHWHSARINSEDLGLFTLQDGRLVNFTSQIHDGVRMTMVEVFNRKGKLEGFGRLQKLTFPGSAKGAKIKSLWKDKNDRFYFIDERKAPVIRIGKIKGL
jgi:hypothetical protein